MSEEQEAMATSEEVQIVQIPDDHRDEVKLLPEDQQPFDYCEVDRRVQSVFFHHDIKKESAWQFFEYVGTTMMSYKLIDVQSEKGLELFKTATAQIENAIEVEKMRLAVMRLRRDDPFAALPKQRHWEKRNGRGEDGGAWKKSRLEGDEAQNGGGERPPRPPKPEELEVRYWASTEEDGKPTYELAVDLPDLKPLIKKLDKAPGYARRLRIISSPKAIADNVLKDFCCRFGDWIRIYQSGRNIIDGKSTAFAEFGTVEAAEACKKMLDGQTLDGNLLEFEIETPEEIEQKNKRVAAKLGKGGKGNRRGGPVEPLMMGAMGGMGGGMGGYGGGGGYGFGGGYGHGGW